MRLSVEGFTPQGHDPPNSGLPKVHKKGMPLRPVVSSIGAVTYATSKELARILKPLVGRSPYQVQNTRDFIQHIEGIHLRSDEIIMSYDVKAVFISVPIQPASTLSRNTLKKIKNSSREHL